MSAKPWIVLKFGGTSVSSHSNWKNILQITQTHLENGYRPLVVCSALAGVSNLLDKAFGLASAGRDFQPAYQKIQSEHQRLAKEMGLSLPESLQRELQELHELLSQVQTQQLNHPRYKAAIMSKGELMSTLLGQAWIESQSLPLVWLDARELLHSEEDEQLSAARHYLTAHCPHHYDAQLSQSLNQRAPLGAITQGFIARDSAGETVLLGRGGSDTSAACLAARIGALELEIWTDVPGMYTANPRLIPEARLIQTLDYDEAEIMAYRGAKVLHPRSLAPVRDYLIPMRIRCTTAPSHTGTLITRQNLPDEAAQVRAISSRSSLCLISAQKDDHTMETFDFLGHVSEAFKSQGIAISSLTTSSEQVSVTLDTTLSAVEEASLEAVLKSLKRFSRPRMLPQMGSISLTGHRIGSAFHQIGSILEEACQNDLRQLLHSSDNRDMTLLVDCEDTHQLVVSLHAQLIESGSQTDFGPTWAEFKQAQNPSVHHLEQRRNEKNSPLKVAS